MRTENEMHDLVRAKVAAHRRRRTLAASAGGGLAAVLVLVAVAVAASASSPEESVRTNPGDPTTTSTTEAPTTTEVPDETSTTSTTTTEPPMSTEAPTTTTEVPSTTTTEAPTTTTTSAPPTTVPGPTSTLVPSSDGDMEATFTITTDPGRPGVVTVRVQITDPTGLDVHSGDRTPRGPGAMIGEGEATRYVGDVPASCGHGDLEGTGPAALDDTVEITLPSGPQRLRLRAFTLPCHDEVDEVNLVREIVVP